MLRVQTGLRTEIYFITQFSADFTLYLILNIPSFIMVCLGYRNLESTDYVSQSWLICTDVLTKLTFGCILLPIVYLIGFLQRENAENIYKSLGLILYLVGHLMNMIILSIIEFNAKNSPQKNDRVCSWSQFWILLVTMLINPFTYNFFNPVLDHFICKNLSSDAHIVQLVYSFVHLIFGAGIFYLVIYLEQRSFLNLFMLE